MERPSDPALPVRLPMLTATSRRFPIAALLSLLMALSLAAITAPGSRAAQRPAAKPRTIAKPDRTPQARRVPQGQGQGARQAQAPDDLRHGAAQAKAPQEAHAAHLRGVGDPDQR
jgi:hypothetical protein